jgi:hypothetical protein
MEDKQIYAYSWKKELIKKIKDYFEERKKSHKTVTVIKPEEPVSKSTPQEAPVIIEPKKPKNIKSDTIPDIKVNKPGNFKYQESPLLKKEKKEKALAYLIGGLIVIVILFGIVIGSGLIQLYPGKINKPVAVLTPTDTFPSPTITEAEDDTPTPTAIIKDPVNNRSVSPTTVQTNCKVSGCNGEICADESLGEIASICNYQERYSCYKTAVCEHQSNGSCGWTQDNNLRTCLKTYQ